MEPKKTLENKNRRETLKKMGVASAFIVPTLVTLKMADCAVRASGGPAPAKFTMPDEFDCPPAG